MLAAGNQVRFDQKRRVRKYAIGKLVLLRYHPKSNMARKFCAKLSAKWHGPFRVLDQPTNLNYKIQNIDNEDDVRLVHVEQLREFNL